MNDDGVSIALRTFGYGCILFGCVSLLVNATGCSEAISPEEYKRIEIMSDDSNRLFAIREPDGHLSMMISCSYAPLWKGLRADVVVRWDNERECFTVDHVMPLEVGSK